MGVCVAKLSVVWVSACSAPIGWVRVTQASDLPRLTLATVAEDPKERGSWFWRSTADKDKADPGGVYIDAAHGVGAPKMEALAKVRRCQVSKGNMRCTLF